MQPVTKGSITISSSSITALYIGLHHLNVPDGSNEEDNSSSNAFYTDSSDELADFDELGDPVDMDLLKVTVEAAKVNAKKTNKRCAEKSDRKVDESFDRQYCDIKDGVLAAWHH
uniref:Uncharacterized protein n=1 Tax=Saccharum officinarum TaxID=4547 RepID=A0A678TAG5_SACOF|nr:hypothetical protein SO62J10_000002 [Saccharum officinarum]